MTNRQAAIEIVHKLRKQGFEALLAGGCVRDMLRGKEPKDYDVATDARPNEICRLFRRTIRVGAKFGVIIVMMDGHQIEVATFRAETGYSDGRRPDKVSFTSAQNDALRRDFTINGMFFDPLKKEVIDYVGGQKDLKKKVIRTIGEADERFDEDYLRMLRAVRFAAQLNFKIEKHTFDAVKRHCGHITKISGERIAMELAALFAAEKRKKGIELLVETGLADKIFHVFKNKSVSNFAIKIFNYLPKKISFEAGMAAMFGECSTDDALANIEILKLSRNELKHITFLLEKRDYLLKKLPLAEFKLIVSEPYFEDLFLLQKAILKAHRKSISALTAVRRRINSLRGKELRPAPLLNGYEIMELGVKAGPQVGAVSKGLYIEQLSEKITTKHEAIGWVKEWLKKHQ